MAPVVASNSNSPRAARTRGTKRRLYRVPYANTMDLPCSSGVNFFSLSVAARSTRIVATERMNNLVLEKLSPLGKQTVPPKRTLRMFEDASCTGHRSFLAVEK